MQKFKVIEKLEESKNYQTVWIGIKNSEPNIYGAYIKDIENLPDENRIYLRTENKYFSYSDINNIQGIC